MRNAKAVEQRLQYTKIAQHIIMLRRAPSKELAEVAQARVRALEALKPQIRL